MTAEPTSGPPHVAWDAKDRYKVVLVDRYPDGVGIPIFEGVVEKYTLDRDIDALVSSTLSLFAVSAEMGLER